MKTVGDNESFTRVVQNENKVKIVKQMPKIVQAKQPTIAIITSQYCEKLAVDAMMEDQETFVRYTTVGKNFDLYLTSHVNIFLITSFYLRRIKYLHDREHWYT